MGSEMCIRDSISMATYNRLSPIKLIAIDFCAFVGSSVFCYLSHRSFLYDHSFRLQSFEASVDFDCGHQSL